MDLNLNPCRVFSHGKELKYCEKIKETAFLSQITILSYMISTFINALNMDECKSSVTPS